MTMFVRGRSGLEEHIKQQRDRLTAKLERDDRPRVRHTDVHLTRAERLKTEGSINALNSLLADLSDAVLLTEDEFDTRFKIGGPGSEGESAPVVSLIEAPYIADACRLCGGHDRVLLGWDHAGATHERVCITCRRAVMARARG